jgi:hypothetical protein|uniref:Uncharacterized protein n=1 Tax=Zea mays TaxID=4577 RepID=B6SZT5_MAIZE|nr:hypothetical protein [Zea mays]
MAGSDLEPLRASAAALPSSSDPDSPAVTPRRSRVRDLLRNLDRRLSNRSRGGADAGHGGGEAGASPRRPEEDSDELGDGAPPEWALLLVGCLLGLATGICVAVFNRGVSAKTSPCGGPRCFFISRKNRVVCIFWKFPLVCWC